MSMAMNIATVMVDVVGTSRQLTPHPSPTRLQTHVIWMSRRRRGKQDRNVPQGPGRQGLQRPLLRRLWVLGRRLGVPGWRQGDPDRAARRCRGANAYLLQCSRPPSFAAAAAAPPPYSFCCCLCCCSFPPSSSSCCCCCLSFVQCPFPVAQLLLDGHERLYSSLHGTRMMMPPLRPINDDSGNMTALPPFPPPFLASFQVTDICGRSLADGSLQTVRIVSEGSPAANYAFDVTPGRLITGLITERGICNASSEGVLGLYPEMKKA